MIPDGWNVYKINELSHYITSGSRGWAQYYSDSGDLFVRITNLTRERLSLDLSDSKYVEIPENSNEGKRTRLMVGDILISITADLGIIGFVENEFDKPAYINQHVALLRIDEKEIDNRFIAYQMASESGHQQFISLNDAGAKSGLNLDSIRRFSILIPPLLEQCRIAEMLGVWDESIDLLERLIGRVRSRKQGLMQQLLTGKKRFKEFERSEWKTVKLRDVSTINYGKSPKNIFSDDGEFPVYGTGGITGYTSTHIHDGESVIIGRKGTIDKVRYVTGKFWAIDTTYYLECKEIAKVKWVYYFLSFANLAELNEASGVPSLNRDTLYAIKFDIPPLPEQEKIAAVLSAADEEISTLEKQLAAYKQQKLGLMQQLLTGRIRI